ncbi:MAG: helix-turn-helix domain-containing protein [Bacteroidales bacterium]
MRNNSEIADSKSEVEILQKGFAIINIQQFLIQGKRNWQNQTITCLICKEGGAAFSLDARCYEIHAHEALIMDSESVISYDKVSRDFNASAMVLSKQFLYSPLFPLSFNLHFEIAHFPVMKLNSEQFNHLEQLFKLAQDKDKENQISAENTSAFSTQILRFLVLSFCYEIYNLFSHNKNTAQTFKYTQKEELMFKFLNVAKKNIINERKITYYAEQLSVTPQYLASVLKELSGLTTNQWVHVLITSKAKHLLVKENLTIQEIANELKFPNQSTFGKLFKNQTGMSPIQFRKKIL